MDSLSGGGDWSCETPARHEPPHHLKLNREYYSGCHLECVEGHREGEARKSRQRETCKLNFREQEDNCKEKGTREGESCRKSGGVFKKQKVDASCCGKECLVVQDDARMERGA